MKKCVTCSKPIKGHPNKKYCDHCRDFPLPHISKKKINFIIKNAGKLSRKEICSNLDLDINAVKRVGVYFGLSFYRPLKYSETEIKRVFSYFKNHTKEDTQKKFPHLRIRTILEHKREHKDYMKQTRWTDKQIIFNARMAGILSAKELALYHNRPRANEGSIKSFYLKNMGNSPKYINGLYRNKALFIVNEECPFIETYFYSRAKLFLWCDMEKHLKNGLDPKIKKTIEIMSKFQKWLWQNENPRPIILRKLRESKRRIEHA